jgi:hypothetical protein
MGAVAMGDAPCISQTIVNGRSVLSRSGETIMTSSMHVVNGVQVELGTLNFQGKDFTYYGSIIDEKRGIILGYVVEGPDSLEWSKKYLLTTWEGKTICLLKRTGSWLNYKVFGSFPVKMWAWSAIINGKRYHGCNSGTGMLVKMKAGKYE